MDKKNIGYDLQMKIRKYFYFMHEHKVTNGQMENEVIGKLSNSLREEVMIKAYGEILQSIPLFAQNFSQATVRELILSMRKLRFYPEEVIFKVFPLLKKKIMNHFLKCHIMIVFYGGLNILLCCLAR